MEHIQLKNITKIFEDREGKSVKAVDDLSLSIEEGEFVTLLGPSGCGKTTTLRLIAGFEHQEEGEIFMHGDDISNLPPYKRNMPMVFQSYALFPHLNVFQNIAYGLSIRSFAKEEIKEKVSKACELVNLEGMEGRYTGELSGGQQQRVALARALVLEPKLILFDEPLSNLDAKLRDQMRGEIKLLQQRLGVTIIYVTHDQSEALSMSDKIVVMQSGKIEQAGSPEEIYTAPQTPFVSDFICNANFLDATVTENSNKDSVTVQINDVSLKIPHSKPEEFSIGEPVQVTAQPENIRFTKAATGGLKGRVILRSFLGSVTEYKILCGELVVTMHDHTRQYRTIDASEKVTLELLEEDLAIFARNNDQA